MDRYTNNDGNTNGVFSNYSIFNDNFKFYPKSINISKTNSKEETTERKSDNKKTKED